MKKTVLLLAYMLSLYSAGQAQRSYNKSPEIILGAGTTHFFGDIGGYPRGDNALGFRDITLENIGLNLSASARYRISTLFAARINFSAGKFNVSDNIGSNKERGFEASTTFFEPAITGEYYFIRNKLDRKFNGGKKFNGNYPIWNYFDAYAFAGVGTVFFDLNPNVALAMRRTPENDYIMVIPAGAGMTKKISSKSKLGLEIGGRYVFGDGLDGYGSRGSHNDIYYFADLTFNVKL